MSDTETDKPVDPKRKRRDSGSSTFYTVFDFELITCSKTKTPCEFDLGDQRIRGYPVSVDRYMVKINAGTEEVPIYKWIGKHHIVVCTAGEV